MSEIIGLHHLADDVDNQYLLVNDLQRSAGKLPPAQSGRKLLIPSARNMSPQYLSETIPKRFEQGKWLGAQFDDRYHGEQGDAFALGFGAVLPATFKMKERLLSPSFTLRAAALDVWTRMEDADEFRKLALLTLARAEEVLPGMDYVAVEPPQKDGTETEAFQAMKEILPHEVFSGYVKRTGGSLTGTDWGRGVVLSSNPNILDSTL